MEEKTRDDAQGSAERGVRDIGQEGAWDAEGNDVLAGLERDVRRLAIEIGERNLRDDARYKNLRAAGDFIAGELAQAGLVPSLQAYDVGGKVVDNIEVEIPGVDYPGEIIVIGAHYDSAIDSPGADDNATGVAALLAIARTLGRHRGRGRCGSSRSPTRRGRSPGRRQWGASFMRGGVGRGASGSPGCSA